jgi:hypothetical protein
LLLATAAPVAAATVDDWVEEAAQGYRALVLRDARGAGGENAVSVVCRSAGAPDVCAMLANRLAARLERARHVVVRPRRSFSARSWDDVGCTSDAAERLGWDVIELHASARRFSRGVHFRALTGDGRLLHGGVVRLGLTKQAQATDWTPPFSVTATRPNEEPVASFLAHPLACALKSLPDKRLLSVEVGDGVRSPPEAAWLERVGERLAGHLNRVIASSFHQGPRWILELGIEYRDRRRVVNTVVRQESAGTIVARGPATACVVAIDRRFVFAARESAPEPERTAPASLRPMGPEDLRTRIVRIANDLQVSGAAWTECLDVFGRPADERRAFKALLDGYDPRREDRSALDTWRAWYEFAHPGHEPYFPDSPANRYVKEVADRLYGRVEELVLDAE